MVMIWFTSDHHFGHENIIKYDNRPFSNADDMDEVMISRWNERVQDDDIVYHLGDVALHKSLGKTESVLWRLRGSIHLIKGNHEKNALNFKYRFESISDLLEVKVPDETSTDENGMRRIILCHYAMRTWNRSHHGAYHLYGHSHGNLPDDPNSRSFDVGVNLWEYYPISFEQVQEVMSKKTFKPIDHHGEKQN